MQYTIDEYDHFLCFLAAESEKRLDLAVQEVEIFAFLEKIEKNILSKSGLSLYSGCFLMHFG